VSFAVFKQKKGTAALELPRKSQAYQITKIVYALKLAAVSRNNRAAFGRAGLVAYWQIARLVAWLQEGELVGQIERLTLRETPKGGDQELVNFGLIN
jgi:hypothetical protein